MVLEQITDPKIAIIVALLFARIKSATYHIPFIGIIVNIAGTFFHELTHYLVALVLNGKPINLSLIPRRYGDGWVLGSVEVSNISWYNAAPIAFAPLSLLWIAYVLDIWYASIPVDKTLLSDLGYLMIIVILVENSILSIQDFKVAFSKIFGIFFFSSLLTYFYLSDLYI